VVFDLVLLGQAQPSPINVDAIQARLDRPDYMKVGASIGEVGFHSAVELLGSYAGRSKDLRSYVSGAQINSDANLRLQYLAGLGLNSMAFQSIYFQMLTYRVFPDDLVVGSQGRMDALRVLLRNRPRPAN
jgi:spermidine synthase